MEVLQSKPSGGRTRDAKYNASVSQIRVSYPVRDLVYDYAQKNRMSCKNAAEHLLLKGLESLGLFSQDAA